MDKITSFPICAGLIHGLLKNWEKEYNEDRSYMALGWKTPKEYLQEKLKKHVFSQVLISPIKTVQRIS